jgi:hypothetical protein
VAINRGHSDRSICVSRRLNKSRIGRAICIVPGRRYHQCPGLKSPAKRSFVLHDFLIDRNSQGQGHNLASIGHRPFDSRDDIARCGAGSGSRVVKYFANENLRF